MSAPVLVLHKDNPPDKAFLSDWSSAVGLNDQDFIDSLQNVINNGLEKKFGPEFEVEFHGAQIPFDCVEAQGEFILSINAVRLLTEANAASQQLDTFTVFARALGHDLATPLQKISMASDLLRIKGVDDLAFVTAQLDTIKSSLFESQNILDTLSSFARLRSNVDETCNFNELIAYTKTILSDLIRAHEVQIAHGVFASLRVPGFTLVVVLKNLLENAIKYRSEAIPRILMLDQYTDDHYEVIIQDNGMGVPKKDQANIFNPYSRGSNVGSLKGKGIGLATCRHIMRNLGGDIQLESPVKLSGKDLTTAHGTRFTLQFPKELVLRPNK